MDVVLLIARLALAVVFVVAGCAKLADLAGSRQAVRDFGVPASLAGPFGLALPLAELAVAIALVPLATAWWGALGALVLLLLFVGAIGYNLARGRTPDCHCFGQLHSAPAGWPTLIRNGLLAAVAALVLVAGFDDPGASAFGWFGDATAATRIAVVTAVVAAVALAGMGWLLLDLMLQNGRILLRIEELETAIATGSPPIQASSGKGSGAGLPVGTVAPAFQLPGMHGETATLDSLRAAGKPVLLVFTDPSCGPCNALMPEIGRWQREQAERLTVAVIGRGSVDANRPKVAEHGLRNVLLQQDKEVAAAFKSRVTPTGVLIGANGTVAHSAAQGSTEIRALVARTVEQPAAAQVPIANGRANVAPAPAPVLQIGEPAPPVELPDLDGKTVQLADFAGKPTAILFWSPTCGFCQRMVNDLKAWEASAPSTAPGLLVVSTGTVEANRAMGLRSRLVLDQGFATGRAFGARGTPAAILVDADGRVASSVATGAPAVLALLAGREVTLPSVNADRGA